MNFRYNLIQKFGRLIYRKFNPVPRSPWTQGKVKDICEINLVPPERLKSFFAHCIKILQKIKGKDIGDYLEFGVFNGSSIGSMYLTAKKENLESMRFFGFDAFQSLPKNAENEDDGVWKKGFYACSFDKMQECLKRRDVNYKQINWVKGWYNKTLNSKNINKLKLNKIGIVFMHLEGLINHISITPL